MSELSLVLMRGFASGAGFAWTDEELEAMRPAVERSLVVIQKLDDVPLSETEPTTQFRMF